MSFIGLAPSPLPQFPFRGPGAPEIAMRARTLTLAAMAALAAGADPAFAKKNDEEKPAASAQTEKPASKAERARTASMDPLSRATFWTNEFNKNQSDQEAAQKLSDVLRQIGQSDRAAEVATIAIAYHPTDKALLLTLGRALIESGHPDQALGALQRAAQLDPKDWRAPSAMGVAFDSMGRRQDAQSAYGAALLLKPNDAAILSNLGLSTALSGDLAKAAALLTQAADAPGADAQVRQNLAVVLAMQGRYEEAQATAQRDLPPDVAAQNIAFVRSMSASGRRWDSLKTGLGLKTGG